MAGIRGVLERALYRLLGMPVSLEHPASGERTVHRLFDCSFAFVLLGMGVFLVTSTEQELRGVIGIAFIVLGVAGIVNVRILPESDPQTRF